VFTRDLFYFLEIKLIYIMHYHLILASQINLGQKSMATCDAPMYYIDYSYKYKSMQGY
jgi:hypothetical protein